MAWLKHESKRFNTGKGTFEPGESFEVPDEDVAYLMEEHGCERAWFGEPIPEDEELDNCVADGLDPNDDEAPPIEEPLHLGGGWYEWNGDKFRKSQLPPEAIEAMNG